MSNPTATRSPFGPTVSSAAPTKSPDPDSWTVHVGPIGVFNDAANYDVDFDTLDEEAAGRQFTHAAAAGSASPTNIG